MRSPRETSKVRACSSPAATSPRRAGAARSTLWLPTFRFPKPFASASCATPAEARDRARYLLDHGADFIKLIATGAVLALGSEPGALELSPEEMKAACDEAQLRGKYCIAHAHGAEGIKAAIRAGARTIEHASYLDAEGIALAKAKGVWLDMDIFNGDYIEEVGTKEGWPAEYLRKNRETTDVQRRGFAAAVKAGAKMTFGTDAAVYPYGLGGRQFAYMVRYGMTPMQAIRSATSEAALALGKPGEFGSLAVGRLGRPRRALAAIPLKDITVLEHVDGVIKRAGWSARVYFADPMFSYCSSGTKHIQRVSSTRRARTPH